MSYVSWEEFWWNNITGAHSLVSAVAVALLESKNVILNVPSDIPWRHSMRSAISTFFQEKNDRRDIIIQPIDVVDDNPESQEPGRFILSRFASSVISKGYREKSKVAIQDYISQKGVIRNQIIWVKGLSGKTAEQWVKFCKAFSSSSIADGLFVLEIQGGFHTADTKHLKAVEFSECVRCYDVQLFNCFILEDQHIYTENWKKYISATAALVCGIDAEVSELLLRVTDFKRESPVVGIQRIAEMPDFERRGASEASDHVLWNIRNKRSTVIDHNIWAAQVQVLFPLIEMERISIIQKWRAQIAEALNTSEIQQYGEVIKNPMDVELGTLCYMMSHRKNPDLYMLYIPIESERNRIRFLHDCRNLLAHVSCCSPVQITELLDNTTGEREAALATNEENMKADRRKECCYAAETC